MIIWKVACAGSGGSQMVMVMVMVMAMPMRVGWQSWSGWLAGREEIWNGERKSERRSMERER
jgi:hypothetical protein